jgi:hypothetical protein
MAVRDYSKGKIYKIVADTDEEYLPYVGSTIEELSQRMAGHRAFYKSWKKGKGTHIKSYDLFDKFGIENCKIILLEEYPCDSKMKLLMKEREWFDKMECCNKNKPFRLVEEKVEYEKEYQKEYRDEHKEIIAEKAKIHYEANKEQFLEKAKIHYEANKEQFLEKKKEKYDCPCGSTICKSSKAKHKKSKNHQNYLSSLKV